MIATKRNLFIRLLELLMIFFAFLFLTPFYFVLVNSLKPFGEILNNAASLPTVVAWTNYSNAFQKINFISVLLNSLSITVGSIILLVVMGSMASWWMVRNRSNFTTILFYACIAAMITPFQSFMIPLMRVVTSLHLANSRVGLIAVYLGYSTPFTIFLYHGFIKSVPIQMEESALIDGCNRFQIYFHIVLPLIRSMTVTVIILQTLLIWNDFLNEQLVFSGR